MATKRAPEQGTPPKRKLWPAGKRSPCRYRQQAQAYTDAPTHMPSATSIVHAMLTIRDQPPRRHPDKQRARNAERRPAHNTSAPSWAGARATGPGKLMGEPWWGKAKPSRQRQKQCARAHKPLKAWALKARPYAPQARRATKMLPNIASRRKLPDRQEMGGGILDDNIG